MSVKAEDIAKGLRVATMFPLDAKTFATTISELLSLGINNNLAFTYYNGLRVYCLENRITYEWKEISFGETGLIPQSFPYPPNTIVDGVNYSGKIFNFVAVNSELLNNDLFFIEPSVNIEIKENQAPVEAMYFGKLNIGLGIQDVALVKNSFVSQSGFPLLSSLNVGTEIKMLNATTKKYLGHFIITDTFFSGYRILQIIEKGDWAFLSTYNIQKIVINVVKTSNFTFELNQTSIIVRKGNQIVNTLNLSSILPVSTATISSAVLDSVTGFVTFTLSDNTSFQLNLSVLLINDDFISKEGLLSVKSKDIYENIFVNKALNASFGSGFYAADLVTNYNTVNFAGFPYPSNRDYVVCRYLNYFFLLVKKNVTNGVRMFTEPNNVISFSFFIYRGPGNKSMKKIAYFKIITRKTELIGLNNQYFAYPITAEGLLNFPNSSSAGSFNEISLVQLDEPLAIPLINLCYTNKLSLKTIVEAPFTLKEEHNGLELFIKATAASNITIPQLSFGFSCKFIQDTEFNLNFIAGDNATLKKPTGKDFVSSNRFSVISLHSDTFYNPIAPQQVNQSTYLLTGDLRNTPTTATVDRIRNIGYFTGYDVSGGATPLSLNRSGDVINATKIGESNNMDIIQIDLENVMANLNYYVLFSIQSLGNTQFDNDLKPITFRPVDPARFNVYIEEDSGNLQNLRIHMQVIQI